MVYVMLDVGKRGRDVRCFVRALENWVIATLGDFNVAGEVRPGRVGVWVPRPDRRAPDGTIPEDKIAAIGVKLLPLDQLSRVVDQCGTRSGRHFSGIVPCGIRGHGVTSLVGSGTAGDTDRSGRGLDGQF
ncbi:MAG: hypothetical protein U5N53_16610 [Mycobacterium sp.]|nr:hypothetical protein [Mycobacterium sp.]